MDSMTTDETYNGYANRETWAFNLHWQNDQGLYFQTLDQAADYLSELDGSRLPDEAVSDRELGEYVVTFWRDVIDGYAEGTGADLPTVLGMFRDEVGSWWRIDYAEVGAAVRESLEVEAD